MPKIFEDSNDKKKATTTAACCPSDQKQTEDKQTLEEKVFLDSFFKQLAIF